MGHKNVLYGAIEELEAGHIEARQRPIIREANELAIRRLPDDEPGGAPLCSAMFHVPLEGDPFMYRSRLFMFQTTFNSVCVDAETWLAAFEALLGKMYWRHATAFFDVDIGSTRMFLWASRMWEVGELPPEKEWSIPAPTTEWERREVAIPDIGSMIIPKPSV